MLKAPCLQLKAASVESYGVSHLCSVLGGDLVSRYEEVGKDVGEGEVTPSGWTLCGMDPDTSLAEASFLRPFEASVVDGYLKCSHCELCIWGVGGRNFQKTDDRWVLPAQPSSSWRPQEEGSHSTGCVLRPQTHCSKDVAANPARRHSGPLPEHGLPRDESTGSGTARQEGQSPLAHVAPDPSLG